MQSKIMKGDPGTPAKTCSGPEDHSTDSSCPISRLQDEISRFVSCLFEPEDIVEVRRIPSMASTWHIASDLAEDAEQILDDNDAGEDIYIGVNPRRKIGGRKAEDVALARCLFADFDNTTVEEAEKRWTDAGLPSPTSVILSGHGIHAYWRLSEPLVDLKAWTDLQKRMAHTLDTDSKVFDPPRIMRRPGTQNLKNEKAPCPCKIIEADPTRRYALRDLSERITEIPAVQRKPAAEPWSGANGNLESMSQALAYLATAPPAIEGANGDEATFRAACIALRDFALGFEDALWILGVWNRACDPPWPERELQEKLRNALKYGKGDIGSKVQGAHGRAQVPNQTNESCPAPIERERARQDIGKPVPISELKGETVRWLWKGYLAPGAITLLSGYPKSGKTTLTAHILRELKSGGNLGGPINPGRALVVTEEGSGLWAGRRDVWEIDDHVEVWIRPFKGRPTPATWEEFVGKVARYVRERKYDLVIIDTLAAVSPILDENNASQMMAALTPLHHVTEAGASVLLIHHIRKSDATQGQAARGSNALTGFADILMEIRPFLPEQRSDQRRVLTTHSRHEASLPELVIEMTDPKGFRVVGSKA